MPAGRHIPSEFAAAYREGERMSRTAWLLLDVLALACIGVLVIGNAIAADWSEMFAWATVLFYYLGDVLRKIAMESAR